VPASEQLIHRGRSIAKVTDATETAHLWQASAMPPADAAARHRAVEPLSGCVGASDRIRRKRSHTLIAYKFAVPSARERWVGPLVGTVNGILTGMTGSFAVPGVMFLQSISLSRDMLVQAMGMLFTASTVALALALRGNDLLPAELNAISGAAVVPAVLGMAIGARVRRRLAEDRFRQVFFVAIFVLGVYIAAKASLTLW